MSRSATPSILAAIAIVATISTPAARTAPRDEAGVTPRAGAGARTSTVRHSYLRTPLRFERLELASLRLERRGLTLCPPAGGAILRAGLGGLRIAAGAPALDLAGRLGQTPIRVASGPIGFAIPGQLSARAMNVTLGPPATASRFRIANLSARIGKEVAGSFAGSDILLAAVPLDLREAGGSWRFAAGKLTIADATFRLSDRQADARQNRPPHERWRATNPW